MLTRREAIRRAGAVWLGAGLWTGVGLPPAFSRAIAQPTGDAAVDPEAIKIFERYVEAIGGRGALEAVSNRRIRGFWEGPPVQNKARLIIWNARPDLYHLSLSEPGGLKLELGYDGETAWQRVNRGKADPLRGERALDLRLTGQFEGEAGFRDRYRAMRVVGTREVAGAESTIVQAVTPAGKPFELAFNNETGLVSVVVSFTGAGAIQRRLLIAFPEYEETNGIKYPSRVVQQAEGTPAVRLAFEEHEYGEADDHDFSMPNEG